MLAEMGGCTLILCFLEYGILLVSLFDRMASKCLFYRPFFIILQDFDEGNYLGMMTYFTLMTSIIVNVFILSYTGDKVKEQVCM